MVLVIFNFSCLFEYCISNAKFRIQCSLKRHRDLHKDFWHFTPCLFWHLFELSGVELDE